VDRFGGIDHLVCNAGISRDALVLRLSEDDWAAQLAVNLTGTFHIAQASLRTMLRRDQSSIVAISSVVGETGNAGQANYAASKAGSRRSAAVWPRRSPGAECASTSLPRVT
jgi:3-oxoacyl-[acyl-carrier protein] reductase